jgi:hypothetical protein
LIYCHISKYEGSDSRVKIQLLRQAVEEQYKGFAAESSSRRKRVPDTRDDIRISWKEVSEFIALHGTYQFGNATCRRKWNEIQDKDNSG